MKGEPMDRDEFMELVYETFADEPDNVLANGIIEAADAYAEHEKAQLSCGGTTSDLIDRQAALDIFDDYNVSVENGELEAYSRDRKRMCELPPAQPEPAIPLSWIEKHIEWHKSLDSEFANLAAAHISVMVKKWRDEQDETD